MHLESADQPAKIAARYYHLVLRPTWPKEKRKREFAYERTYVGTYDGTAFELENRSNGVCVCVCLCACGIIYLCDAENAYSYGHQRVRYLYACLPAFVRSCTYVRT